MTKLGHGDEGGGLAQWLWVLGRAGDGAAQGQVKDVEVEVQGRPRTEYLGPSSTEYGTKTKLDVFSTTR